MPLMTPLAERPSRPPWLPDSLFQRPGSAEIDNYRRIRPQPESSWASTEPPWQAAAGTEPAWHGAGVARSRRGKQPRAVEPGSGGTPREDTRCPATRTWAQRTGPNRRPAPIATGTTAVAAPYAGRPTYARPP